MSILYGLLFLAVSVSAGTNNVLTTKVSVTVYYEALNPACERFFKDHLTPTYLDNDYTPVFKELELLPFGMGKVVDARTNKYACPQGVGECQGNRFHACAIEHIQDTKMLIRYINCLMGIELDSSDDSFPVETCKSMIPADIYSTILKCYRGMEGWGLLQENARLTEEFFSNDDIVKAVPYVSFDNSRSNHLAEEALMDFKNIMFYLAGGNDALLLDQLKQPDLPVGGDDVEEGDEEEEEEEEDDDDDDEEESDEE